MNELDTLRTEVAELREACKVMLVQITLCLAGAPTSAQALATLLANVGEANRTRPRGEMFDEMSVAVLRALSSTALKQHPDDPAVLEMYRGLRPGQRH